MVPVSQSDTLGRTEILENFEQIKKITPYLAFMEKTIWSMIWPHIRRRLLKDLDAEDVKVYYHLSNFYILAECMG